jgi:hypothetical protein
MSIDWSQVRTAEAKAAEATAQLLATARTNRQKAFTTEADPLFFQVQRGEATQADYDAKVAEIRTRFPYPAEVK